MIIPRSVPLRIRNVSERWYRENRNTHFMSNHFLLENPAADEIMWKNTVQQGRPQIIWRKRIACWTNKATNKHTHSIYNNHCVSVATLAARTPLNVTLYVHCLSCIYILSSRPHFTTVQYHIEWVEGDEDCSILTLWPWKWTFK